mgnify:CR=1 FL=1
MIELQEQAVCRTALPPELNSWAAGKGLHLSLINRNEDVLSQQTWYDRTAVLLEELPEEIREVIRRKRLFKVTTDGYLQRGDTYVCSQPLEARARFQELAAAKRQAMESADSYMKTQEDIVAQLGEGHAHVSEPLSNIPDASAHVVGGAAMSEILANAVRVARARTK